GLRLGDAAMVVGLGAIGQLAVQMCKLAGAGLVIAVDPIETRRQVALRHGADAAFDPRETDVGYEAKRLTDRRGVDVVIETSASVSALQLALRGLAYAGTIAYAGWARAFPAGLDLGREAHFNSGHILFSRACSEPNRDHPRWSWARIQDECWRMLENDLLNCEEIIWPVVPLERAAEAYMECVDRHPERSIKLGVSLRRE
ncbi:MAG: zinc-binding alcohol dehydrogenase, partial [Alicyclobacillus sp.]|nr:zinc-binding alcohol dehydrogenase [Alicyclobacillus sp.]